MHSITYPAYKSLKLDWPAVHVLRVTLSNGPVNAMDQELHRDISQIWKLIDADPAVNAVIVTGDGAHFSAGGSFELEEQIVSDYHVRCTLWKEARALVQNMINCSKPIVSAINGAAAGGGLAVALLADVSIAGRSAKLVDAHTRFGVAAGDHAAVIWPLLCGLAKAKYYLLTCEPLYGEEAERIGLVTMCVDDAGLQERALAVATRLAQSAPAAIRLTKLALNNWIQQAWPIFEASLAYEMLGFSGPEVKEGLAAMVEKRKPSYDPLSFV